MKVVVQSLDHIDTAAHSACVKILIWLSWRDSRLVGWGARPFGNKRLPEKLWSPLLSLDEKLPDMVVRTHWIHQTHGLDNEQGCLEKLTEYHGSIRNTMNLR
jgi:hypothetical protein